MIKTPVVVKSEKGLDGRPIALLVQEASQYASKVYIQVGEKNINAKSIMGIITLGATYRTKLHLICEGSDEEAAAEAMENLFRNRFE